MIFIEVLISVSVFHIILKILRIVLYLYLLVAVAALAKDKRKWPEKDLKKA